FSIFFWLGVWSSFVVYRVFFFMASSSLWEFRWESMIRRYPRPVPHLKRESSQQP
ncbi:unnamed protein product, partial [Choristocarpus tenellus]